MNRIVRFSMLATAAIVALLAFATPASAKLVYSFANDLSSAQPLDGAEIPVGVIYVGRDDSGPLETLDCCRWIAGPGSAIDRDGESLTAASGIVRLDLARYPAGSLREATAGPSTARFEVIRAFARAAVSLTSSGPIIVTKDWQVIEGRSIESGSGDRCAVHVNGASNVTLRNLDIRHANIGICGDYATGLKIEGVRLTSTSTPVAGPHCDHGVSDCKFKKDRWANPDLRLAIKLSRSPDARLQRIESNGASGAVFTWRGERTRVNDIVCKDVRGPYPRGQCVQFVNSNDSRLTNFYSKIWKDQSRSEDNVNAHDSERVVVEEGLIDGNYSINGVGVIADTGAHNMTVRNVDIIHTAVSAVSVYSNHVDKVGRNFRAENVRVKDTTCSSRDGGKPSSDGLVAAAHPAAKNMYFQLQYHNHCRSTTFWCKPGSYCSAGSTGTVKLTKGDFTPRQPLVLQFDWQAPKSRSRPVIRDIVVR